MPTQGVHRIVIDIWPEAGTKVHTESGVEADPETGRDLIEERSLTPPPAPRSRHASGVAMEPVQVLRPRRSTSQDSLLTTTEEVYRRYEYRRYTPSITPRASPNPERPQSRTRVIPIVRQGYDDRSRPPSAPVYRSASVHDGLQHAHPVEQVIERVTPIPIERQYRSRSPPRRESRARSTEAIREPYEPRRVYNTYYEPDYDEIDNDGVSRATHRFYDRDGRALRRENRREERVVEITRSYETLDEDPREWRNVIKSQRQAAPGLPKDDQKIKDATQSLGNLPVYINKRLREQEDKELENRKYLDSGRRDVEHWEHASYTSWEDMRYRRAEKEREQREQRYAPRSYREPSVDRNQPAAKDWREQERTYNGGPAPDGYSSLHRSYGTEQPQNRSRTDSRYGTMPEKPNRQPPVIPASRDSERDQIVAVSGKHRCGHCGNELGRGQAMIIESLMLYYHLPCFRCYVCGIQLGNGMKGADVRVRDRKLHCQSCYSNDAVQLSKV
ncbi:unnamed protein product, partial [Mesorhabditis spiculigera]